MFGHERLLRVRRLIVEYVQSPSLRHLRDQSSIDRLAEQVVHAIDREPSVWRKWEGQREEVLRAAAPCWIPIDDLRNFLNDLPGPKLSITDVTQRLRAIHEEPYSSYPEEGLKEACREIYEQEVAEGTEMAALIGALQEFVEAETERRRSAAFAERRLALEREKDGLRQRFLAGADCKWISLGETKDLFSRRNGRAFRLSPTAAKRWVLFRIENIADVGKMFGTYSSIGQASKVVAKLAYEKEPRW